MFLLQVDAVEQYLMRTFDWRLLERVRTCSHFGSCLFTDCSHVAYRGLLQIVLLDDDSFPLKSEKVLIFRFFVDFEDFVETRLRSVNKLGGGE